MRVSVLCPLVVVLIVLAGGLRADLISDGGFGSGGSFSTDYLYSEDLTEAGTVVVGYDPCDHHPQAASYGDHSSGYGRMLIANGSIDGSAAVWAETVSVVPNTEYMFYYWLSAWTSSVGMPVQIRCLINDVRTGPSGYTSSAVGEWGVVMIRWNSGSNTQANIRLCDRTGTIAYNDFALDDIGMIETEGKCVLMTDSTLGGSVEAPGEGPFLYPPGEVVALEAKCEPGYEFGGWVGQFSDPSSRIWITMDSDCVASATFRKLDHQVTMRASALATDAFTLCDDSADRLDVLCGATESEELNGLILGERKGVCGATYRFPIFRPPTRVEGLDKVVVHVYGRTITAGATVWIGDTGPHWAVAGDVHTSFNPRKTPGLLEDSLEPVYWLTVRINATMGGWDLAAVYASYECPGIPQDLLRRFHDYFSICEALECYAQSPSIRDLFSLRAAQPAWETVMRTMALTEDVADSAGSARNVVKSGIDDLHDSLIPWQSLAAVPNLAALTRCNSEAIVDCLDEAAISGRAFILAYADAIGDGSISHEEARAVDVAITDWRDDLSTLKTAMDATFYALRDLHDQAMASQENSLRVASERMIRSMAPWLAAKRDDSGSWTAASPSYLEWAIDALREATPQ